MQNLDQWKDVVPLIRHKRINFSLQAVRTASAEVKHSLQSGQLSCNNKVQWNNKKMSLELSGRANLDRHLIFGSAAFKSPFENMEQISISGRHSDDGSNFQSELQSQWGNKRASAAFTMTHSRNGWFIDNSGELTVTTPIYAYRMNKLTWNHHNDRDEFKPHVELEIGDDKSVLDIDATSNYKDNRKYKAQIKSSLETPYTNKLRFDVNHEHDKRQYSYAKSSISTDWAPNKVMQLEYEASLPSSLRWSEEFKFTSPFRGYERITLDTDVNLEGPLTVKQELKWGSNKKVSFEATGNVKGSEIDGRAKLTSPWTEPITLDVDNKKESGVWISSGTLQYSRSKRIELNTRLSNNELKRINVDFKSPCPYLSNLFIDLEHRGDIKQFETKLELNHNYLREAITADMKFDIARFPDMQAQMNLKTPFEKLPFFSVIASHQSPSDTKLTTTITINHPICQTAISNELNLYSWKKFNSRSSIEYCGEKIQLTTQFSAEDRISGVATLKTPFTEDMSLTINHQGEPLNFQSSAEVAYGAKKITTTGEFSKSGKRIRGTARINTPFRQYEIMAAQFNHRGGWKNFENDAAVEIGSTKWSGETEFSLRGDKMKAKASAVTPIAGLESLVLNVKHDGDIWNFNDEASFEYSGRRIYASAELNTANEIAAKVEIRTPFRSARTFIAQINHAGQPTNFQNSGSIQINSDTYTANSALMLNGNKLEARALVKMLEEYSIVMNHQGAWKDFNNRLTIDMAGKRIDGESSFTMNGYDIDTAATLKTPFTSLETVTASYKYAGYPTNFQTSASLAVNRMRGNVNANFNKRDDNLSGKFEVTSTFRQMRNLVLTFDHSGFLSQFENSASIDLNGKSYTGSSRFSVQGNQIQGNAELRLPDQYRLELTHKGTLKNWKNSVELNLKGDVLSGYTSYK